MKRLAIITGIVLAGIEACAGIPSAQAQTAGSSSASSRSVASSQRVPAKKKKKHHSRREPKQMSPTPDRIQEIQSALASNGYYQGTPSGKWDSATIAAMQRFQGDHGLDAAGKLDALSLQKLGLGSEIAGVSAPKPVKATPARVTPASTPPAATKPVFPNSPNPAGASSAAASATAAAAAPTAKPATPPQPQ